MSLIKKLPQICIALIALVACSAQASVTILPKPNSVETQPGVWSFKNTLQLHAPAALDNEAAYLKSELLKQRQITLTRSKVHDGITIRLDDSPEATELGDDGYRLIIRKDGAWLAASKPQGVFNGIQTLLQLIPVEASVGNRFEVPAIRIEDSPRFAWRAAHLDVSRHFYGKEFIKRYLDFLAMHKMNIFHWHLTDHQGWRVQIDAYPKLTSVGAWRRITNMNTLRAKSYPETVEEAKARLIKEGRYKEIDGVGYFGGFYTKEDIREIIAYAAERHIEVVPEIDIPGHTQAVIASYPELMCTSVKEPYEVCTWMGLNNAIMCPGKQATDVFLDKVFAEVLELFPSKYIHIGADESHGGINEFWKNCDDCKARLKKMESEDFHDLQIHVIDRVSKQIKAADRTVVGWGEAFYPGIDKDMVIMSWWGTNAGERAARHGNPVVMTPHINLYFNSKVHRDYSWIEVNKALSQVYEYDPAPERYTEQMRENIIGSQPCLWSEYVPTYEDVEFRVMPNLIAAAEMAWTEQAQRDFADFQQRIDQHYPRLDVLDVHYYVAAPSDTKRNYFNESIRTNITSEHPNTKIFIEHQGNESVYTRPLTLSETTEINTWAISTVSDRFSLKNKLRYQKIAASPTKLQQPKHGLNYTLYKLNKREDKLDNAAPLSEGVLKELSLPVDAKGDNFALVADGYIRVREGETLSFDYGRIDDALKLSVAGVELYNSRGNKDSSSLTLSPGFYPIHFEFYEYGGAEIMDVELRINGQLIRNSSELLFRK